VGERFLALSFRSSASEVSVVVVVAVVGGVKVERGSEMNTLLVMAMAAAIP